MRVTAFVTLLLLAGCTPPSTEQVYRPSGERVDLADQLTKPMDGSAS